MDNICMHIECNEPKKTPAFEFCQYHNDGGVFGSGETYEQYQIIEKDFIDFIRIVPLVPEHYNVHSPMLRDIIIRTCVQIEIFFKEWLKYDCSLYPDINKNVLERYNKIDNKSINKNIFGARNWTFGDYFSYKSVFSDYYSIHVMPINLKINPMDSWASVKQPPIWWEAYNSIKHSGHSKEKNHNLKNAMYTLSALYLMHCTQSYSNTYLTNFISNKVYGSVRGQINLINGGLTTPLDSKKYLFKRVGMEDYLTRTSLTEEYTRKIIS